MTVTFDVVSHGSQESTGSGVTSLTVAHTVAVGGSLQVFGSVWTVGGNVTSVTITATYNGVSMTDIRSGTTTAATLIGGSTSSGCFSFYLLNCGDGASHNIVVTPSQTFAPGNGAAICGLSVTGAGGVSGENHVTSGSTVTTSPTNTITVPAGGLGVAGFSCGSAITGMTSGTQQVVDNVFTDSSGGCVDAGTGASASQNFIATTGSADWWGGIGFAFTDAGAGPTDQGIGPFDPFMIGPFWQLGQVWPFVPPVGDYTTVSADQATTAFLAAAGWLDAVNGQDAIVSGAVYAGAAPIASPVIINYPTTGSLYTAAALTASPVVINYPTTANLYTAAWLQATTVIQYPTTGSLFAAAALTASVGHDAQVSATLYAAAWLDALVGHDAAVTATLYAAAYLYASQSNDQATIATLFAGAWLDALVAHNVPVTPALYAAAALTATVGHDVPVSAPLYAGAWLDASPAVIAYPTVALLPSAAHLRAGTVGHDAQVVATLFAAAQLRASVGHDTTVSASLWLAASPSALVTQNIAVTARLFAAAHVSATIGVAPIFLDKLITEAIADGRSYTLAVLNGETYTVPILDGRTRSENPA